MIQMACVNLYLCVASHRTKPWNDVLNFDVVIEVEVNRVVRKVFTVERNVNFVLHGLRLVFHHQLRRIAIKRLVVNNSGIGIVCTIEYTLGDAKARFDECITFEHYLRTTFYRTTRWKRSLCNMRCVEIQEINGVRREAIVSILNV